MSKNKQCTKQCDYTDERCQLNIPGWEAAICHCPIDGAIVIWEVCDQPSNQENANVCSCDGEWTVTSYWKLCCAKCQKVIPAE